jgi:hypothetical protein
MGVVPATSEVLPPPPVAEMVCPAHVMFAPQMMSPNIPPRDMTPPAPEEFGATLII